MAGSGCNIQTASRNWSERLKEKGRSARRAQLQDQAQRRTCFASAALTIAHEDRY